MKPIVITGGPGAGKTTLLNALGKQGYATFAEGSRSLIEQQSALDNGILPWTNLPEFAKLCLNLMSEQKREALNTNVALLIARFQILLLICKSVVVTLTKLS